MTTPIDVVNLALSEIGQRITINAFTDTSPAAKVAALNYGPRIKALFRSANWGCGRSQITLTLYKATIINGVTSANPPLQPWLYEYLQPPDCLDQRFLLPTIPIASPGIPLTTAPGSSMWTDRPYTYTATPFVGGTDFDPDGNLISVILTNMPQAQLVYTRDLSQFPDLWDSLFLSAATAYLGCYFINALERNAAQYNQQASMTKGIIDQARMASGQEGIGNVDHIPDWIRSRNISGLGWGWNQGPVGQGYGSWAALGFPDGLFY